MIELLQLILHIVASLFKSRAKLEAEILVLRQQLNVLRRQVSKSDRSSTIPIAFCWFGSVAGSLPFSAPLQSSGRRRSSAGIEPGSTHTGARGQAIVLADRESQPNCAGSLAR